MHRTCPIRRGSARLLIAFLLALASGCGRISPSEFSGDVDVLLSRGESYVRNLAVQPSERLGDEEVLALGYLERVRLGLGSPFRTVEYVLRDPDLSDRVREPLAYGILAGVLDERAYFVDPTVLEIVQLKGVPDNGHSAHHQLRLIERTIETAPTPAAGERTVRLGYLLAATERTVEPGYSTVVANVAALVADRKRAREDATQLLRAAARYQVDPLALLRSWRREGLFRVEQPPLAIITVRDEEAEARNGPAVALALRTLAQRQAASISLVESTTEPFLPDSRSYLDSLSAERLAGLSVERNYPAQAPVAVAVAINRKGLIERPGLLEGHAASRTRFAEEAWNEERLIARATLLEAEGASMGVRPPLILLQAATFLRGWNQEEPWFPGDPSPTARDLEARFGLAAIRFDDDLPESWRAYHLGHLGRSLADLKRVFPTVSLRGLTIRIGELPAGYDALALHEPRTRTLHLPPKTGAGTLAHELAHDIDWQLARTRYGARGGYATDMSIRANRHDRIAAAMMELSASLVRPSSEVALTAHATRSAEVFARGTDWLVSSALAREGRLGGYLTSFQDPILTGYGTTRGPDITGGAVPALLAILESVAPLDAPTRGWALDTYGPNRSLTAAELASAVANAGAGLPPENRVSAIEAIGLQTFSALSDCRYGSADAFRRLVDAQRELASVAVAAAARGAAIDAVHALASELAGPESEQIVDAWLSWRLYGAPEPVSPVLDELAPAFEDLLQLRGFKHAAELSPVGRSAFQKGPERSICGGNPFAADTPAGRFQSGAETMAR